MLHRQWLLMSLKVQWQWQMTLKENPNKGNKSIEAKIRPAKWSKIGAQISEL
jgi:hypothetical protein